MNAPKTICPQCHRDVVFMKVGGYAQCPDCGVRFPIPAPPVVAHRAEEISEGVATVLSVVLKVVLIMVALVVVGLGVAFAGCLVMIHSAGPH